MTRSHRLALVLAVGAAALSGAAVAQTPEQKAAQACRPDFEKLCPQAIGKPDEVKACLRANIMKVSAPCREAALAAR